MITYFTEYYGRMTAGQLLYTQGANFVTFFKIQRTNKLCAVIDRRCLYRGTTEENAMMYLQERKKVPEWKQVMNMQMGKTPMAYKTSTTKVQMKRIEASSIGNTQMIDAYIAL